MSPAILPFSRNGVIPPFSKNEPQHSHAISAHAGRKEETIRARDASIKTVPKAATELVGTSPH
jgi:hypothetical protein